MNEVKAEVVKIDNLENLNIVTLSFGDIPLVMMGLELANGVKIGSMVELSVKPTHVAIAKEFSGMISFSNKLNARIIGVENGKLLSSIKLIVGETIFESIVSLNSSKNMNLQVDDEVTLLIKASELFIRKVL
ncbi:MAG: TOBE domain-containing protein [Sulfurospirillaceae bacterium]|nr:TOBE domain-containing protein [Sulfurospirillaceae bacterium]